jgi:uncharacterized protein YceH (UPF0502 family)
MHPIESLEMAKNVVQQLMNKPEPLVKQIAPARGSRAERYVQLLSPELHEIGESEADVPAEQPSGGVSVAAATVGERVARLERQVTMLRDALAKLAAEVGATDPFANREREAPSREGEAPSEPSSSGHAS